MTVSTELRIGDLYAAIKPSPPLAPDDTAAKAARLFRARGVPLLLVVEGSQLTAAVYEADLLQLASQAADSRAFLRHTPVSQVARSLGFVLSAYVPLSDAARQLVRLDLPAAPVIGGDGRYLGVLLRRDLLAALAGEPVPAHIAGLATPLGVHLTTGALRAGASNIALASTGVAIGLLNLVASNGTEWALTKAHHTWRVLNRLATPGTLGATIEQAAVGLLVFALFLLLLRLSPISSIHAAEHMVVHAIEEGEDLTLEKVRPMPRVHPRCGTNLVALMAMILVGEQLLVALNRLDEVTGGLAMFGLVIIVLITWRRLGHGLQRFITTKPPSDRQLERALRVGEDLLAKMAQQPGARAGFLRRLWNSGFPQVLSGFVVVFGLSTGVEWLIGVWSH